MRTPNTREQHSRKGLRYQSDYVLDDMVRSLGMSITHDQAPFEPESGAYHSHGQTSSHSHKHSHEHQHEHHEHA